MIQNIDRAKYDSMRDRINFSTLKMMGVSPAHYLHAVRSGSTSTDAKKAGRVLHIAVFEPERFRSEVVVWTGKVRNGGKWEEFQAENEGREILTMAEHARCFELAEAVRDDKRAREYLVGQAEATILFRHEFPAVADFAAQAFDCKARVDCLGTDFISDLKLCVDASPEGVSRACWTYQWHVQAAWYLDGYERVTGKRVTFKIIAVEGTAPRIVQVYSMPDDLLDLGRETYRTWLDRLDLCRRENRWPGYSDEEMQLTLPPWVERKRDDDLSELGLSFGGYEA